MMAAKVGATDEFPEIDRAEFSDVAAARRKIKSAQMALIEELESDFESHDLIWFRRKRANQLQIGECNV